MYSVCILIYVSMYLYSYQSTHGISGLAAGGAWEQFEVRLKMTIEWTQRYTPGCDRASLEMHLEAVIKRVCRCTWRPWSCELGGCNRASLEIHLEAVIERVWRYVLGGHDRANSEAVIERGWRSTWRPWSCELEGCNRASLEIHLKAVIERVWGYALGGHDRANLEAVIEPFWRCTWRP